MRIFGNSMDLPVFDSTLRREGLLPLARASATTLQVNGTKRCNLACHHCHVESSPKRTEAMDLRTVERVLELLAASSTIEVLDLTGGAPEMHEHFRYLVSRARALGRRVIDRCNLTVLYEPGQEDTAEFLARNQVTVVASLPCYTKENVEAQRGRHVFDKSIEALRWLNRLGYGKAGSHLVLDLVYNPLGATLPPDQSELERTYHQELRELFGIEFHHLYTITNMPIKRFADLLVRRGEYEAYLSLLVNHFNSASVSQLMCRSMVSVGYDGALYDCDFNQMLELPIGGVRRTVWDIESLEALIREPIATDQHCYGCTAGSGSSCGGVLV